MLEPRVKLLLIVICPYSALPDACTAIIMLMKQLENNFQLTVGRWKLNLTSAPIRLVYSNKDTLHTATFHEVLLFIDVTVIKFNCTMSLQMSMNILF